MIKKVQEIALQYHSEGLQVLPIKPLSKEPAGPWKKWQYTPQKEKDIKQLFPENCNYNIGIICGDVSGDLIVIDIDSRAIYKRLKADHKRFSEIVAKTRVIQTGRGYHIYLTTDEPAKSENLKALGLEIRSNGQYVCAPPSVHHETGVIYRVISNTTDIYKLKSLDELKFLKLKPDERTTTEKIISTRGKVKDAPSLQGLGWKAKKILFKADLCGYASRSEAEAAVVMMGVKNGLTWEQIKSIFIRFASDKSKFKTKGIDGFGWLYGVYNSALKHYENNISELDKKLLFCIDQVTKINPFSGRTKHTDRAILLAFLQRAREMGKTHAFNVSIMEMAELASISTPTAWKSIKRLVAQGDVVTIVKKSNRVCSTAYSLNLIKFRSLYITLQGGSKVILKVPKIIPNDALRWGALGKHGASLIKFIKGNVGKEFNIIEIVNSVEMERGALTRQLEILRIIGVVERKREVKKGRGRPKTLYNIVRAVNKDDLTSISIHCGTYGKGEKQKIDNAEKRRKYREGFTTRREPKIIGGADTGDCKKKEGLRKI